MSFSQDSTYSLIVAACWNNAALVALHQGKVALAIGIPIAQSFAGSPSESICMLARALEFLDHPCLQRRCFITNNACPAVSCIGSYKHGNSFQESEKYNNQNVFEEPLPQEKNYATNKSLLTSVDVATDVDLAQLDVNSPLLMFGRPFSLDTSMLLLQQQQSSYHIVAAVVMYNAAFWYHLKAGNNSSADGQSSGSMAEFYYQATLFHAECALQLNERTLESLSPLLLATWNNLAHLQCIQKGVHLQSGTLLPQCRESMRFLLKNGSLVAEEYRVFHLNCFLLQHLGNIVAPAA